MNLTFCRKDISFRVGDNFFFDCVKSLDAFINKLVSWDTFADKRNFGYCMSFFFREKLFTVCYQQTKIPGAGSINSGIVDLVHNTVTEGEPNFAVGIHRGTNPDLELDVHRGSIPGAPGAYEISSAIKLRILIILRCAIHLFLKFIIILCLYKFRLINV